MRLGTLALLLLVAWYVARWVRARVRQQRADKLPAGVSPMPATLRPWSEHHYDACVRALRAFAEEYRLTFQRGRCTRQALLALQSLREEATGHMSQVRMRLPNDLHAEQSLVAHIEDTERLLRGYVEDAQARCGEALLHPGPIDDMYYRQFYRAHNDAMV